MPMRGKSDFFATLTAACALGENDQWAVIVSLLIIALMTFGFVLSATPVDEIPVLIAASPW